MTTPLKVLHVLEAIEGGTARHVADLTAYVSGVEHHVVVPEQRSVGITDVRAIGTMTEAGTHMHHIDMRRSPISFGNARALRSLRRLVKRLRPNIVHGHSSIGGALGRLAARGVAPAIYTPNGLMPSSAAMTAERLLAKRFTSRIVAVSESEALEIVSRRLAPASMVTTIRNGVSGPAADEIEAATDLRGALSLPQSALLVGSIARLVPQKAPEVFLAAAERIVAANPDVHVVFIGGGSDHPELEAKMREATSPRIHHLSHLAGASASVGQLDVFVLSSNYEGGPYAPIEAMLAGVPVVLSDVTGNRDCIEHDVSGLLVPRDAPEAIASAVLRIIGDRDLADRLVAAGKQRAADLFSIETMTQSHAALYAEVSRPRHG